MAQRGPSNEMLSGQGYRRSGQIISSTGQIRCRWTHPKHRGKTTIGSPRSMIERQVLSQTIYKVGRGLYLSTVIIFGTFWHLQSSWGKKRKLQWEARTTLPNWEQSQSQNRDRPPWRATIALHGIFKKAGDVGGLPPLVWGVEWRGRGIPCFPKLLFSKKVYLCSCLLFFLSHGVSITSSACARDFLSLDLFLGNICDRSFVSKLSVRHRVLWRFIF